MVVYAILSVVETFQGAPQATRWLDQIGLKQSHFLGIVSSVLLALVLLAIAFPGRARHAFEALRGGDHGSGASAPAPASPTVLRTIDFGHPYRAQPRTYEVRYQDGSVTNGAPAFSPIVIPVTARGANIAHCRVVVAFTAKGFAPREVRGRWENRQQPMGGFGTDWSVFDSIDLLRDDAEDVAIAVQHDGDAALYILCNRSWEMPLHHGQLNFQHPGLALPVSQITVTVTVRGDEMPDQVSSFELQPGDRLWHPLDEPVSETPAYDAAQVRRAVAGAITKLEKQRALIYEWRLHGQLDPGERGEWETEDRKGILHQDSRLANAYLLTESAFDAISLMNDPTSFHRDNALAKIDAALSELRSVLELIKQDNGFSAHTRNSRVPGGRIPINVGTLKQLQQRGVDLLNKDCPGVDRSLLDRAAESWIDQVRETLASAKPETAVYFTIEEHPSLPRAKDQSRRVHELVQRLGLVIGEIQPESKSSRHA